MTRKRVNPLLQQKERLAQQEKLVQMAMTTGDSGYKRAKKISMNITLPQISKEKLQRFAEEKQLSASVIIQMWIDEHCV